jgi:hypothetical protein
VVDYLVLNTNVYRVRAVFVLEKLLHLNLNFYSILFVALQCHAHLFIIYLYEVEKITVNI